MDSRSLVRRRGASLLLALVLPACAVNAGGLRPPPGYYAPVVKSGKKARECPRIPAPFTGELKFPSKYEGSDKARDDFNAKANARYKALTAPITETEKQFSALVNSYMHGGQPETLQCALDWLVKWASAGALLAPTQDHTGKSVRKWALASLASAWLRLKFSASKPLERAPDQARLIENWFGQLATIVVTDWKDQPLDKINNHEYWAAWAVMATAVSLDRRDLFDWAAAQYRIAARQIDAQGYLPNELKRETRALHYHNYSLGPLTMIAAFARANGVDLASENNRALQRLGGRVLQGVSDPEMFRDRTGDEQVVEEMQESSKFAWLEPYCWLFSCEGAAAARLQQLRPIKTYRLGGPVSELFAPQLARRDAAGSTTNTQRRPPQTLST